MFICQKQSQKRLAGHTKRHRWPGYKTILLCGARTFFCCGVCGQPTWPSALNIPPGQTMGTAASRLCGAQWRAKISWLYAQKGSKNWHQLGRGGIIWLCACSFPAFTCIPSYRLHRPICCKSAGKLWVLMWALFYQIVCMINQLQSFVTYARGFWNEFQVWTDVKKNKNMRDHTNTGQFKGLKLWKIPFTNVF